MKPSNKGKPRPKPDHKSKNTGPGKASGIKPTAEECTKRVRLAADLICSGWRRSQIIEQMCSQYGVAWQTVQEYCRRARELLIEETGKPKQEHVAEVFGEYQQILRDKEAGHSDKLQALKGKREMLGLDQPKRAEISGPDGGRISLEAKVESVLDFAAVERELSKLGEIPSRNGEPKPLHPAGADTEAGRLPGADGD